jgi:hypothetical protein
MNVDYVPLLRVMREEVHRIRQELAAKFDFDVDPIVADIRKRQVALGSRLVSLVKSAEPCATPDLSGNNAFPATPSQQSPRKVS